MIEKTTITLVTGHLSSGESELQRFERIILRPEFKQLKAVFDNLGIDVPALQAAIIT